MEKENMFLMECSLKKLFCLIILFNVFPIPYIESISYFTEVEKCKITTLGKEYIGNINETETGKPCVQWTNDIIDKLNIDVLQFADRDIILANNFCRNPNSKAKGPWCVVDKNTLKWEYCNINKCMDDRNWCKDTKSGEEYIGKINKTINGFQCQSWINQENFRDYLFPENNLDEAGNTCRNPDNYDLGPWCYTVDKKERWGACDIPFCDETISQIEYFGGYDFLKTIPDQLNIIQMDNLYANVTFVAVFKSEFWTSDIKRKTSLWATDYSTDCQTDFDEYEYCKMATSTEKNNLVTLVFQCIRPIRNLIFLIPLLQSQYNTEYRLGDLMKVSENSSVEFLEYTNKINKHLKQRNRKDLSIPASSNHGYFFLLSDNVIPYAITSNNKVVITISEVGKGRIGFLGCEHYLSDVFQLNLKDYFKTIFDEVEMVPKKLTKTLLQELYLQSKAGKTLSTPIIWNSHELIGETNIKLLLELVKNGLRIIIGIKPWAYHYYAVNLDISELKDIFKVAGIWPSLSSMSEKLIVLNNVVFETFPLVHLLNHANTNISNALSVADAITNALHETPFDEIGDDDKFKFIGKNIGVLYSTYMHHVRFLIPCLNKAISNTEDKQLVGMMNSLLIQPLGNKFIASGVSFYPGKMQSRKINYVTVQMKLKLKFKNEVFQLGLYASPGKVFSVEITKSKSEICTLQINYHLFNVFNKNEWEKWPNTYKSIKLKKNKLTTFSFAFGGLLSISCSQENDVIDIILNDVIQVPMYDRRDEVLNKNWNKLQLINTPWAVISGDTAVFVVSSNAIRNMAQPNVILELYDSMIKEELHLRGKSVSDNRRELISSDIQIKAGYMHAGYPIGTMIYHVTNPAYMSKFLFGKINIKEEGRWGILHEIGHNLQDPIFTFSGTVDVTNNVFTLIGIESMTGANSWSPNEGWLKDEYRVSRFISYINKGEFTEWQNEPFLGLGVYAQIQGHFGWELFSQLFRKYDTLIENFNGISDHLEIQLWIKQTSLLTKMNLCPLYDLWRWPIDLDTNKELMIFPYFLPDDFLTKSVPEKVNEIILKYGGSSVVKRQPLKIPIIIGNLTNKLSIEGSKIIEEMIILN